MKFKHALILTTIATVLLLTFIGCGKKQPDAEPAEPSKPSESAQEDFDALRGAIRQADADAAIALVTDSTIDIYELSRKLALDANDAEFEAADQTTVLMAFQLRYLLKADEIRTMTANDIFRWAIEEGMLKRDTFDAVEIHEVRYEDDRAYATVTNRGKLVEDTPFQFLRRDGHWKLDMADILHQSSNALDQMRTATKRSKAEMALSLLEKAYNTHVPTEISKGPLQ